MTKTPEADLRESVRVVTDNAFITCHSKNGETGKPNLSLNARKILYISVAQVKKDDAAFKEFILPVGRLAETLGVNPEAIYPEAKNVAMELMSLILWTDKPNKKGFTTCHVFDHCNYDSDLGFIIKLNAEMAKLLLNLKGDFSKPLLKDFMHMKSKYSVKIWHLLQREMNCKVPGLTDSWCYPIDLDELREVTETEDKFKTIANFKTRVLDVAMKEIKNNCGVNVTYSEIKRGRGNRVTGFNFYVESIFHIDLKRAEEIKKKYGME